MSPDPSLHRAAHPLHAGVGEVVIVRAPVAPLHGEARVSASQVSQALAGHALAVEAREGEWLRVRGGDDYPGWVHVGYVEEVGVALGEAGVGWYAEAPLALGCRVRGPFGRRRLPMGAVLLPGEEVEEGEALPPSAWAERFPRRAAAIVETARWAFAGTSYQWGGRTPWGADCSGLVQSVFGLHGVPLPRDAWQQALEGEEAGGDPGACAAGELLFFSDRADGRVTHVGVAAGGGAMVHLALGRGGWAEERLDDDADPYVRRLRRNFRLARRLPGVR